MNDVRVRNLSIKKLWTNLIIITSVVTTFATKINSLIKKNSHGSTITPDTSNHPGPPSVLIF